MQPELIRRTLHSTHTPLSTLIPWGTPVGTPLPGTPPAPARPGLTLHVHTEVLVVCTQGVGGHAGVVPRVRDSSRFDPKDLPLLEDLEVAGAFQELRGDPSPEVRKRSDYTPGLRHVGAGQSPASHTNGVCPPPKKPAAAPLPPSGPHLPVLVPLDGRLGHSPRLALQRHRAIDPGSHLCRGKFPRRVISGDQRGNWWGEETWLGGEKSPRTPLLCPNQQRAAPQGGGKEEALAPLCQGLWWGSGGTGRARAPRTFTV